MEKVKETIDNFMKAWKEQDRKAMHSLCTKTYKVGNTEFQLKGLLPHQIASYKVGKIEKSTEVVYDATVSVKLKGSAKPREIKVRSVCEIAPWKPSLDGDWGVNPISALKGLNG